MFPDGKIDKGETKEKALQREIIEETGIQYLVETNGVNDYKGKIYAREILIAIREFAKYKQQEQYIINGR